MLPHLDSAYTLARYLTRNAELSEDIVQDAFARALKAFPQFRGGSARAWILAIVRNCCHSAIAARRRDFDRLAFENAWSSEEEDAFYGLSDGSEPADEILIRNEETNRIGAMIEAIPEPFREALVLRDIEDLSYREIAEVTGVALGTVMSRLSRARALAAAFLLADAEDGVSRLAAR
jgi:RNA polymerase sigma-70 factor (ECF subfamily)